MDTGNLVPSYAHKCKTTAEGILLPVCPKLCGASAVPPCLEWAGYEPY